MGEVSTDDVDLFGEAPAPYRDPRGRRKLRFDAQTYKKVENLRALGMNQEEIATAINVSVPTLRKYFLPELQAAVSRVKARVFLAMMDKVDEGSVPAMRAALQLLEQGGAMPAPVRSRGKAEAPVGKKLQADLDAITAHRGTDWGSLLPN